MAVASAAELKRLRSLIRSVESPSERERFPFSSTPLGIPRGALIEVTGAGKTEAVVQFLRENPRLRVAWIEDQLTVNPSAIQQRGVDLRRLLFVETGSARGAGARDMFWSASQILRSGLFECVIMGSGCRATEASRRAEAALFDEKNLRRLQLEVEKANTSLFLLAEQSHKAWPITMKLEVSRLNGAGGLNAAIERDLPPNVLQLPLGDVAAMTPTKLKEAQYEAALILAGEFGDHEELSVRVSREKC